MRVWRLLALVAVLSLCIEYTPSTRVDAVRTRARLLSTLRAQDKPEPIAVTHLPPTSRGRQLLCTITIHDKKKGSRTRQFMVDTDRLKTSYIARRQYFDCMSGGRANHRQTAINVPYDADVSMDWGLKMSTSKDLNSTSIQIANTRDERVLLKLDVKGRGIIMNPKPPIERIIEPRDVVHLIKVSRDPNNTTMPYMLWRWRAEPYKFIQRRITKLIQSYGVTLSVEHHSNYTRFTVFNDRSDHDTPIFLWFDVNPLPGTKRENLVLSHSRPVRVRVMPHHKKTFLTVRPFDINKPWLFTFTYKWQCGSSPADIFGISPLTALAMQTRVAETPVQNSVVNAAKAAPPQPSPATVTVPAATTPVTK